jgi:hypothetical protein
MSWVSATAETIKALKKPEHAPLLSPYPLIKLEDVPPASAAIFYGTPGNAITERIEVNLYKCPFHPPFHSALTMRDLMFHNVGRFRTNELLQEEFRSSRRIDIIIYKKINTEAIRAKIMQATILDTSEPHFGLDITDYGVLNFIHFGFYFVYKGKELVCSGNVVKLLLDGNVRSSEDNASETTPHELVLYAMNHPDECEIRTLWIGAVYAKGY